MSYSHERLRTSWTKNTLSDLLGAAQLTISLRILTAKVNGLAQSIPTPSKYLGYHWNEPITFNPRLGRERAHTCNERTWRVRNTQRKILEEEIYLHHVAPQGQKPNLSYDRNCSESHNKVERETRWRPSTASTMSPTCRPCRAAKPPAVTKVTWSKRVSRVGTLGVKHLHLQHSRILQ